MIRSDGSVTIFRDYAIPTGQFELTPNKTTSRLEVPAAGFV
jgi:hypothetical protein